jgi:hypothetical protein
MTGLKILTLVVLQRIKISKMPFLLINGKFHLFYSPNHKQINQIVLN